MEPMSDLNRLLESLRIICEAKHEFSIKWKKPDLKSELGEYFENDFTKDYFAKKGLKFETENDLLSFLNSGRLVAVPKRELISDFENLTVSWPAFASEMGDPEFGAGYRKSFESLHKAMRTGNAVFPAPILIRFRDGQYYGFAGNRRTNLAWRYKIPVTFWLVTQP